jgi:hypothetical protein
MLREENVLMYVGLDVHRRFCYGTMMNEEGEIVKDGRFGKDPRCLDEFMEGVDEATVAAYILTSTSLSLGVGFSTSLS